MKNSIRRLIAGVSAAALLMSAVGFDAFMNMVTRDVAAVETGKNGRSTGFSKLEQDTDKDIYNTGYGLHTNKTATEVNDGTGRTFDVNLESWYVGENPVDVATILDASGSMAWTVDTLDPLEINDSGFDLDKLQTEYGIASDELDKIAIENKATKLLTAIQNKDGGYLPQDVVDLILNPKNTDNSKLSYANYKYYVYEDRSTVSEFVPLGYWDGAGIETVKPIGYYPFDGTLENKVNSGTAKLISRAEDTGGTFDADSVPTIPVEPFYIVDDPNTLDLKATAEKGGLMLDIDTPKEFTIAMRIKSSVHAQEADKYEELPILYIGNLEGNNYIKVVRSGSDARKIKVYYNNRQIINYGGSKHPFHDDDWINLCLSYGGDQIKINAYDKDSTTSLGEMVFAPTGFSTDNAKLVIGGDIDGRSGEYSPMQLTDFCVFNTVLTDTEITILNQSTDKKANIKHPQDAFTDGKLVAFYDFGDADSKNKLENRVTKASSLKFIKPAVDGVFSGEEFEPIKATTVYTNDSKSGSQALNLTQTSKNSAILLDKAPSDSDFTLSFAIRKEKDDKDVPQTANIFYMGSLNTTNPYYEIFRDSMSNAARLRMKYSMDPNPNHKKLVNVNTAFDNSYKQVTLVFKDNSIEQYIGGKPYSEVVTDSQTRDTFTNNIDFDNLKLILGGLFDNDYSGSDIFLDDLYVFDEALDANEVATVANNIGKTEFTVVPSALTDGCKGYHATSEIDGEKVDIAQIKKTLAENPNAEERRGWYYVNSHSTWADIEGCLKSGKQYIGIYDKTSSNTKTDGVKKVEGAGKDIATTPSGASPELQASIIAGNTNDEKTPNENKKFNEELDNERSIRFYVDTQGHLRCFAWSGSTSKEGDIRTFCSLVYEKKDDQITKYEELNNALNTFYQQIAENSDLSNNAVVRFSTNNAIDTNDDHSDEDQIKNTNTNLKKLIMKDWTNWSDYYQKYKEDYSGAEPNKTSYLHNLLQAGDKSSTDTTPSLHGIDEYPYVMTGGTYTWTGLKAFYDNMVKNEDSQTAKNIVNDARNKYLIIFTDGRDNTQDYDVIKTNDEDNVNASRTTPDLPENVKPSMAGSPDYTTGTNFKKTDYVEKYNPYKEDEPEHLVGFSITDYYDGGYYEGKIKWDKTEEVPDLENPEEPIQCFTTTGGHKIETDGDLAEAWADKLKDEGYTIYCVMLATGSISEKTNADEFNKAKNFLKSLAGGKDVDEKIAELEEKIQNQEELMEKKEGQKPDDLFLWQTELEALKDNYVLVVDPSTGTSSLEDAFEQILEQIQQPRSDYTVQDYIDPRFNLIGKVESSNLDSKPHDVIYHLGANGIVTFTNMNNDPIGEVTVEGPNGTTVKLNSGTKIGNIIDHTDDGTEVVTLAYTPRDSYMVNRRETTDTSSKDGYDTGDGTGTGYLYYDDVKDMYYLRWEDQVIPMEDEAFDTDGSDPPKHLDVWSATIRLQAKEDFIGGNNILTNGNEAGENLVYSDATIENMDKNPTLYFTDGEEDHTLREKLQVLSGTNRKINAVDAGGVSQAVYGDGIDIPSSGFPRVTVNVRLKPLDAKNLNDVIYMGEVLSPTMMLADLENGYMEGSYYLEYLRRYAYRLYGKDADKTPLLDLLNEWLKIDNEEETAKTFTIPYIYLPDPVYENDKLKINSSTKRVEVSNSTGASWNADGKTNFTDLNLLDVTGFITYTWKRDKDSVEEQQLVPDSDPEQYDITKEYVVKNTDQIVYNLQLKFTPLHEGVLEDFNIDDEKFITKDTTGELGDKFFHVGTDLEFAESTDENWTFTKRSEYLQAMVKEQHTYTPHVAYNETSKKWELKKGTAVPDEDTYDWNKEYKPVVGNAQIEGENLTKYYTQTPENVGFADKEGNPITDQTGAFTGTNSKENVCSLVANTTYVKDVVNGALALELIVDGTYLKQNESPIKSGYEYKIIAKRYYDDPIDPLPYNAGVEDMNADTTDDGKKYQLTFRITDLPKNPQANTLYQVWAELEKVAVLNDKTKDYDEIKNDTTDDNKYIGYQEIDALPIGTYVIDTTDNPLSDTKFKMGVKEGADVNFKYLKIDNAPASFTYDKFPESVYNASQTAPDSTGVDEYLIKNGGTDNAPKNTAESNRKKESDIQTLTFYFGTVDSRKINGTELSNTKSYSHLVDEKNDYAKDRLGIILLSADPNSLAISKTVTNTDKKEDLDRSWEFTITFKPDSDGDNMSDFNDKNKIGFELKWYKLVGDKWELDDSHTDLTSIKFDDSGGGIYTKTLKLKHNEKVVITGLPEGKWHVTETDETGTIFYSAHNNMDEKEDHEFSNATKDDIQLNPASHVDFVNEFPHALPSAGGTGRTGINIIIYCGIMFVVAAGLYFTIFYRKKRKISDEQQR